MHQTCVVGVLGEHNNNVEDTRAINTVLLIAKTYIMKFNYEQSALSRVDLARLFIYKVMIWGKLHENDVFVKPSQMFEEMVSANWYLVIVSQYCLHRM